VPKGPGQRRRNSPVRTYPSTIYRDQRNHHDCNQGHNGPDGDPANGSCHRYSPERCLLQSADRSTFSAASGIRRRGGCVLPVLVPPAVSRLERPGWTSNRDPVACRFNGTRYRDWISWATHLCSQIPSRQSGAPSAAVLRKFRHRSARFARSAAAPTLGSSDARNRFRFCTSGVKTAGVRRSDQPSNGRRFIAA
jgi:hypothetical protein